MQIVRDMVMFLAFADSIDCDESCVCIFSFILLFSSLVLSRCAAEYYFPTLLGQPSVFVSKFTLTVIIRSLAPCSVLQVLQETYSEPVMNSQSSSDVAWNRRERE